MPEPAHRHDIRLWLARHADDEPVTIHVGRTGYGEMTCGELRAELAEHPGVAALLRRCDEVERSRGRRAGSHIAIDEVRALLGGADNNEGERQP